MRKRLIGVPYMKRTCVFVILLSLIACSSHESDNVTTGDLFFSPFRIGSYYNKPDSFRTWVEARIDTINLEKASKDSKMLHDIYNTLRNENLLYKPFVDLKIDKDSYVKLYLDSADYDEIKKHKWNDLRDEGKKVTIKARTRPIGDVGFPLLYCVDLVEVNVVSGETLPGRSKFKIEDYE